jgi:hypothetical protein
MESIMPRSLRSRAPAAILLTALAAVGCRDTQGPAPVFNSTIVDITAVTHGAGGFLAVGVDMLVSGAEYVPGGDVALVGRSANGTSWEWRSLDVPGAPLAVASGGGVYVAVGIRVGATGAASGIILHSVDGVEWEEVEAPSVASWSSVARGNGFFLAAGHRAGVGTVVVRSGNGRDWEELGVFELNDAIIAFAAGHFHLSGSSGAVYSSFSGHAWQTRIAPRVNRVGPFAAVGNGIAASGLYDPASGTAPQLIEYYALTGTATGSLSADVSGHEGFILRLAAGNGVIVGLSVDGLLRSEDLIDWTVTATVDEPTALQDVIFADDRFVAVGRGNVRTSTDGTTWMSIAVPTAIASR